MDLKFYASVLTTIKRETDKRDVLYTHGIDLVNYENAYTEQLLSVIQHNLEFLSRDDLDWWLYDDVEKVYYYTDPKREVDVSDALVFLRHLYTMNVTRGL